MCKIQIIGKAIEKHIRVRLSNSLLDQPNIRITGTTAILIINYAEYYFKSFNESSIASLNAKVADSLLNTEETPETLLFCF